MRRFILVVAFYLVFAQLLLAASDTGTSTSLFYPDLQVIVPADKILIEGAGNTRRLQYTHNTFNAGPGPLVIQPALNSASGNYQGSQYIYSYNSSEGWALNEKIPVAGAFVFHSEHGHFHFPLVILDFTILRVQMVSQGTPLHSVRKTDFVSPTLSFSIRRCLMPGKPTVLARAWILLLCVEYISELSTSTTKPIPANPLTSGIYPMATTGFEYWLMQTTTLQRATRPTTRLMCYLKSAATTFKC